MRTELMRLFTTLLGIDHQRFTFKNQGLDDRLTGVESARLLKEIIL